jgi:5-hydroxyisourate hydrolase
MSAITTHVLDLSSGRPAAGLTVTLERRGAGGAWTKLGEKCTDADGRVRDLLGSTPLAAGVWRLTFATGDYFVTKQVKTFLPEASITFEVFDSAQHHHVPLLLSPFGFSTYRGS